MNCVYILKIEGFQQFYIGSTSNFKTRLNRHNRELTKNIHHSILMQADWNKSTKKLISEVLVFEDRDEAYELEQLLIDEFLITGKLYNIGKHVRGGDNLTHHPDKEKIKQRIANTNIELISAMTDSERKVRFAHNGDKNGMFGKTHSPEVKAKLSEINRANPTRPFLGKQHSSENKALLSARAKERIGTKNPFFGRSHSEVTKKLLSDKLKGNKPPNERPVMVDGVKYRSITDAARQLGLKTEAVFYRTNNSNPKFSNYVYVT